MQQNANLVRCNCEQFVYAKTGHSVWAVRETSLLNKCKCICFNARIHIQIMSAIK
jgi:hypothetical protein